MQAVGDKVKVINEPPPFGKDYNDYLCYVTRIRTPENERRKKENERER